MNKLEFYQKHYFAELERRKELNDFLSIPVGALGLLCGALAYLVTNFSFDWNFQTAVFCFLIAGAMISILFVLWFLLHAIWRYQYCYLSFADNIRKYENDLRVYYASSKKKQIEVQLENEIEEMIIRQYAKTATSNAKNNEKKSANLYKSNMAIVFLVIFLLLSAIPFFGNHQLHKQSILKIDCEVTMGKEKTADKDKQDVKSQTPAEKPKEPEIRVLNEFSEKEVKKRERLDE